MFRKTVSESRMVTPEKEELGVSMVWRAAPRGCGGRRAEPAARAFPREAARDSA